MRLKYAVLLIILIPLVMAETSSSSINWLSKRQADSLYCLITSGCGGSGTSSANVFNLYVNYSYNSVVDYNLNLSDSSIVDIYITGGDHFVFGGTLT